VFICDKKRLQESPPCKFVPQEHQAKGDLEPYTIPRENDVLRRIMFQYVESHAGLISCLGSLHTAEAPVHTIILDDLDVLCRRLAPESESLPSTSHSDEKAMVYSSQAHAMAVLVDACKGLENKLGKPTGFAASMTASMEQVPSIISRARLWIPKALYLRPEGDQAYAIVRVLGSSADLESKSSAHLEGSRTPAEQMQSQGSAQGAQPGSFGTYEIIPDCNVFVFTTSSISTSPSAMSEA